MLPNIRKWFIIRGYIKKLGPKLRERYGGQDKYTPAQIKSTLSAFAMPIDLLCYALAMYCDRTSFDEYHRANGEKCDYDSMREEIGDRFFNGNDSFDADTIIDNWSDSDGGDHDSGDSSDT